MPKENLERWRFNVTTTSNYQTNGVRHPKLLQSNYDPFDKLRAEQSSGKPLRKSSVVRTCFPGTSREGRSGLAAVRSVGCFRRYFFARAPVGRAPRTVPSGPPGKKWREKSSVYPRRAEYVAEYDVVECVAECVAESLRTHFRRGGSLSLSQPRRSHVSTAKGRWIGGAVGICKSPCRCLSVTDGCGKAVPAVGRACGVGATWPTTYLGVFDCRELPVT